MTETFELTWLHIIGILIVFSVLTYPITLFLIIVGKIEPVNRFKCGARNILYTSFSILSKQPISILTGYAVGVFVCLLSGIIGILIAGLLVVLKAKANILGTLSFVNIVPFTLIAGLFLSNFPEALSSSANMKKQGWGEKRIFWMWFSLMVVTAIGSVDFCTPPQVAWIVYVSSAETLVTLKVV